MLLKKYLKKFNVCIDKISINKNTIIKHIYLGKYNKIKDEIMDIKYFDKQYILKAIIEITSPHMEIFHIGASLFAEVRLFSYSRSLIRP